MNSYLKPPIIFTPRVGRIISPTSFNSVLASNWLNIDVLPSVANFFLINLQNEDNANNCIKFLSERKIYVRGMAPYKLGSFIRVSIGNEYEMKKFVSDFIEFYVKNK